MAYCGLDLALVQIDTSNKKKNHIVIQNTFDLLSHITDPPERPGGAIM
jgi:hypothetical protein